MKIQNLNATKYAEIIKRIHEITNTDTQVGLAYILNVKQSSISDAKKRHSIPAEWLLKLYWKKKINPDWVLTGQGGKLLQPTDCEATEPETITSVIYVTEIRPPEECSVQELMNELAKRALNK